MNDTIIVKNEDGEEFEATLRSISKAMGAEEFAEFFDDFLNSGMKDYGAGEAVGVKLQETHRTLQASAIRFSLGIILGLSEQEYTDPRNETPIAMGQKIAEMIESRELKMGYMI